MNTDTKLNHWFSVENSKTGEPDGLLCSECSKSYPFKGGIYEISCSESNWFAECSCCNKSIQDEYVQCPHCKQIYPKGTDSVLDSARGKGCFFCELGI